MKLGLWTLKFNFHIVFSEHEIFCFFSQPLKNIKTTLSSGGGGGGADCTETGAGPDLAGR